MHHIARRQCHPIHGTRCCNVGCVVGDAGQALIGEALIAFGQVNHQRRIAPHHHLAHQFAAQKTVAADQYMPHRPLLQLCDRITVPARIVPMPMIRVRFIDSPHMK